jgi:hypothetical protein
MLYPLSYEGSVGILPINEFLSPPTRSSRNQHIGRNPKVTMQLANHRQ